MWWKWNWTLSQTRPTLIFWWKWLELEIFEIQRIGLRLNWRFHKLEVRIETKGSFWNQEPNDNVHGLEGSNFWLVKTKPKWGLIFGTGLRTGSIGFGGGWDRPGTRCLVTFKCGTGTRTRIKLLKKRD
jgi:hypothetical protein